MSDAVPDLSAMCARSDHGRCPHLAGARMPRPWRRRPGADLRLCRCPCHADCPLAARPAALQEVWAASCTCPGAERSRASFARSQEISRIAAEVDMSDHPDAEEIESRLRAVFEERRRTLPLGLPRTRPGYRTVGVVATVAAALTAAAAASSGRRRLLLGAAAAVAWSASGYAASLVSAVAGAARSAEARPSTVS